MVLQTVSQVTLSLSQHFENCDVTLSHTLKLTVCAFCSVKVGEGARNCGLTFGSLGDGLLGLRVRLGNGLGLCFHAFCFFGGGHHFLVS